MALVNKIQLDSQCYIAISTKYTLGLPPEMRRDCYKLKLYLGSAIQILHIRNNVVKMTLRGVPAYQQESMKVNLRHYPNEYYFHIDDLYEIADQCSEDLNNSDKHKEFKFLSSFDPETVQNNYKWHYFGQIRVYSPSRITVNDGENWRYVSSPSLESKCQLELRTLYNREELRSLDIKTLAYQRKMYNNSDTCVSKAV